jgi:hypothetical protein
MNNKAEHVQMPYNILNNALIKFEGKTYKYFSHAVMKYTGEISIMATRADLPDTGKITAFFHLKRSVADSIFPLCSSAVSKAEILLRSLKEKNQVFDLTGKAELLNWEQAEKWVEQIKKKYEPSFFQRLFRR